MFLLRRLKNFAGKLRVERARQHTFERLSGAVPHFDAVGKLVGPAGDDAQSPALAVR